ncbi:MAG: 4Fe-4S dicluster domain-containing protein [Clostridia bacterium]|nr:4Fe-4S dicluster domain-containing protein [Clostridia bacterium]
MAFANIRGVFIRGSRKALRNAKIAEIKTSANFCVPLKYGMASESKPLVSVGENVKKGSVIASPIDNSSAFIYSPVCGNVVAVDKRINSNGQESIVIEIEPSTSKASLYFKPIEEQTKSNLFGRLVECGSVDTWGKRLPSYKKYLSANIRKAQTLIVKLYDSDGFVYSNCFIAKNYAKEVALGALLYLKISNCDEVVFTVFDEQDKIVSQLKNELLNIGADLTKIRFYRISRKYPLDEEHLLAKIITRKTVRIEHNVEDFGVFVESAQTCLNFYNAVYKNEPTISSFYTISGNTFKNAGVVDVLNGTKALDIFSEFKIKNKEKFSSFALGGAMAGIAQVSFEAELPISQTSLVSFEDKIYSELPCINCGKCTKVCPTRLEPMALDTYAEEKDFGRAKKCGAEACINCGLCSYVCPAKRNLAQRISDMKDNIIMGRTM